jgi:hypothetical protein
MFFSNLFFKNIARKKSILDYGKKNKISYSFFNSNYKENLGFFNYHLFSLIFRLIYFLINNKKKFNEIIFLFKLNKNITFFNKSFIYLYIYSFFFFKIKKNNIFFLFSYYKFFINFNFLFYKWFLLELKKKNYIYNVSLPVKRYKYTILRSPFIFKKGREQFEKQVCQTLFCYSYLFSNNFFYIFYRYNIKKMLVKHKFFI